MTFPRFIMCRADGEPVDGEFAFYVATDENDFTPVEEGIDWHEEPTEYVILRVDPDPVTRRTFYDSVEEDE